MEYEKIIKRFYDELENGKMMGRKCTRCGAVEFPPHIICNSCGCFDTEWMEITGDASLNDFALSSPITTNPELTFLQPYAFGCITLEEGTKFNAVVSGISKENATELRQKIAAGENIPLRAEIISRQAGYKSVVFILV